MLRQSALLVRASNGLKAEKSLHYLRSLCQDVLCERLAQNRFDGQSSFAMHAHVDMGWGSLPDVSAVGTCLDQ